jgi:hypothetical protein
MIREKIESSTKPANAPVRLSDELGEYVCLSRRIQTSLSFIANPSIEVFPRTGC